jgi:hypothetical protein
MGQECSKMNINKSELNCGNCIAACGGEKDQIETLHQILGKGSVVGDHLSIRKGAASFKDN